MNQQYRWLYCPGLRMKAGELGGVSELAPDVAACTLPRFIVPPRSERDERQYELAIVDGVPDISVALARHWRGRSAFIDATYVIDELGRDRLSEWLPTMFERARRTGARPIPMASLRHLEREEAHAFRFALSSHEDLKLGLRISSGEMVGPELRGVIEEALQRVRLTPRECAVIADFHDADFSVPERVAPIISGALELLQDIGPWKHIIFQGTNFPETNPAKDGASKLWPRNEWSAWRRAVHFDASTAEQMMFGDYGADCAKMAFGKSGAAAIRHYRYTTGESWLIERGVKVGNDKRIMQRVCSNIVASGHFAGPTFSTADAYIFGTARNGDGPGNSTIWRQVNTTHHITRVVADVAKVRGISIAEKPVRIPGEQISFLD